MTAKKPLNRRLLFRAAWARAKFIAAWLCEPVMRHLADALRDAWDIAKNGVGTLFKAPPVETAVPDVKIATHVASLAALSKPAALIRAVSDACPVARTGIRLDHILGQGLRMVPQPCQQQQACAARPIIEPTPPAHPPHLSAALDVDHGAYVSEILAELMDDDDPPRPEPTLMETGISRAFLDGLMLGRSMAISEIETLFADLIAKLRQP